MDAEAAQSVAPNDTIGEQVAPGSKLHRLAITFLGERKRGTLKDVLDGLHLAPMNTGEGNRLLHWLVGSSVTTWILGMIIVGVFALLPVVPTLVERHFLAGSETITLDMAHDIAYWFMYVVGLPIAFLCLVFYTARLPDVVLELGLTNVIRMTSTDFNDLARWAEAQFARRALAYVPVITAAVGTAVFVWAFLANDVATTWLNPGTSNKSPGGIHSASIAGWVALLVNLLFWYMVPLTVCRIYSSFVVLHELFRRHPPDVQPLHPDGRGGLFPLGRLCMRLNVGVFLFGIITVSPIVTNHHYRGGHHLLYPLDVVYAAVFMAAAAVAFFLPLYAAHSHMRRAKYNAMGAINGKFNELNRKLIDQLPNPGGPGQGTAARMEEYKALREMHDIARAMPVYPFNIKVIGSYLGSIATGILMPWIVNWLSQGL